MPEVTIDASQGARTSSTASTPGSWDSSHDQTTAGSITTTNQAGGGWTVGVGFSGYAGGTYYIYRALLDFDLSDIPAGSSINSAKLKIYGANITSPHFSIAVNETDFIILKGTFTDGSTLATSMVDEFEGFQAGWDGTDAGIIEYTDEITSWNDSAYNEITLNSTARTDIAARAGSSTRLACLIMNHDHDYHDNINGENGSAVNATYDYWKINFNINPSSANPPQLVVDYVEADISVEEKTKLTAKSGILKVKGGNLKIGT